LGQFPHKETLGLYEGALVALRLYYSYLKQLDCQTSFECTNG